MRVLLIGSPAARARLRRQLDAAITIQGEFDTEAAARVSGIAHDALLVASDSAAAPRATSGSGFLSSNEDDDPDNPVNDPLTPRELQVLELLAVGHSNKAIAARLGISDQTVKFHVAAITGKLGASNRTDAVRRALRRGLIAL